MAGLSDHDDRNTQVGPVRFCCLETGDNVLLLGPPGVGETHLAVALGLKAYEHDVRVLFTTEGGRVQS